MYQIIQEVSHESVIFMTAAKSSTQMNTMHNVYLRRSVNAETVELSILLFWVFAKVYAFLIVSMLLLFDYVSRRN